MKNSIHIDICSFQPMQQNLDRKSQITQRQVEVKQLRQYFLSARVEQKISDNDLESSAFGKPFIKNRLDFSFNYSHSQHYFALASSPIVKNIGLDIEEIDRKVKFEALAQHAFHPEEYQQWKALNGEVEYWFKIWTTKEAVLKASGLGIRINLNTLNTHVSAHGSGGMCQHEAIGAFAYQHYVVGHAMLTVAWSAIPRCSEIQLPQIKLQHHLTSIF